MTPLHLAQLLCHIFTLGLCIVCRVQGAFGFGNDRILLDDVKVLTLYDNKMTQGRRSSPVPQLKCVGGSAGCSAFRPQVVQCYNRGSDGYDIQWECKTDMDNSYRFGQIEVTCEGYHSPDDEYVLKGSCGLEYTLDLTKEGMQSQSYQKQHSYYGNDDYHGSSYKRKSSGIGDWITLAIIGVIIYGIYRSCIATSTHNPDRPDDGYPRQSGYGSGYGSGGNPPPPGFRPGYGSDSCSGSQGGGAYGTGGGRGGMGGGGFWSGAATGGIMGYLFGGRGNRGYGYGAPTYGRRGYGTGGFFGGGGGSGYRSAGGFSGGSFGGGGSTGTRTASGFGSTRRR
ncbi:store-operated calcium entry-associated regulatory factor-like [Patiria miniata]|uniref:Store-operated calcium entry-associated regulatory factor n=1 Tax=Patiria miniata TaxID=46514 RepID=A0A913ZA79_PATMI|nr:store-operated calcium entry-associated regulatory factor-like [Patiria miniata]XP_038048534.1 store-operated calcium entry-associated regulatory factor-like [Patiria miniata]